MGPVRQTELLPQDSLGDIHRVHQPERGQRLVIQADTHCKHLPALGESELQKSRQTDSNRQTEKLKEL